MSSTSIDFNIGHNAAFKSLGAIEPRRQWSSFDVHRDEAKKGLAKLFVMTIWNYHRRKDENGKFVVTSIGINKNVNDGTFWYRIQKPTPNNPRKTWVAHWDGLNLALTKNLPIRGVLKDAHSGQCSLDHVFECINPRMSLDGSCMWLQLVPSGSLDFATESFDIDSLAMESSEQFNLKFEASVKETVKLTQEEISNHLATAPTLPQRVSVISTVFKRNPFVVAFVRIRAAGICEHCKNPAPFLRKVDNSPFLEIHHKIRLADGGRDTVENTIALCPNCHREAHYG